MEPEREGRVQQINNKIDNIWEQVHDLAGRVSSVVEFLQGQQTATPNVDEPTKEMGCLDRTNDRLESIIVVLDGCVIQARRLQDEGFISNATQERYETADQNRLEQIQQRMQEVHGVTPVMGKEVKNG